MNSFTAALFLFHITMDGTKTRLANKTEDDLRRIIREEMSAFKDEIYERLDRFEEGVDKKFVEVKQEILGKVLDLEKDFQELNKDVKFLKIQNNIREQRDRDKGLRIFDFKVPDSAKKSPIALANHIHKEILEDVFLEAKKEGLINYIPSPLDSIEYTHVLQDPKSQGHSVPPGANQSAQKEPVIILKLISRSFKSIVYKYKKAILTKYNRKHGSNVHILDDMTKVNLGCISRLKKMKDDVKSAFMLGGKIRYELFSKPEKLFIVHDPYAVDLTQMSKRLKIPE